MSSDPKPEHDWNGVSQLHDCRDCPQHSAWRCDRMTHDLWTWAQIAALADGGDKVAQMLLDRWPSWVASPSVSETDTGPTPTTEPIEGRVLMPGAPLNGPRCYAHPGSHAGHSYGVPGRPAHIWESGPGVGACLRCSVTFVNGDRYVCDDGGIVHVTCPAPARLAGRGAGGGS